MEEDEMLGQPEGMIPPVLPKAFDPMVMVGDAERVVHAVPAGTRALCGYESAMGWQWARGEDIYCPHCHRKIMLEELEKNRIVQALRRYGSEVTRESYIFLNWMGCKITPWNWEFEEELPELLRDYTQTQWPWPKRKSRRHKAGISNPQ